MPNCLKCDDDCEITWDDFNLDVYSCPNCGHKMNIDVEEETFCDGDGNYDESYWFEFREIRYPEE